MGEYRLKDTPAGLKTLVYTDNSREIRLHSAYDPIKEAERSINSFHKGKANLIIICGLGLGYHANILKRQFPDCMIIAIERDKAVADLARKTCPENLEDVIIANSKKELPSIFEEIDISKIQGVATFYHRPSYTLFKEFYNDILKDVKEYITSKVSDLLTRFEFEETWFKNMLKNADKIFSSTPVADLFGKFKNYPGIIVSAGPSLRKNVKHLEALRDRALIVCVDTALKVLQRNNISPHLVMTLDSQKYSLKHFLGLKNYNPVLLADVVSYPRVLESYNGKKILSTTSKYYTDMQGNFKRETTPLWDWLEEYAGPLGDIQSGGSVATSVFDLLLNLGCDPIILIGQDLAYSGREIHCSGTYHNDDWLPKTSRFLNLETFNQKVIRKRKIKYVEAFKGEGVTISDFVFDLYRYWFEDSAAKVGPSVINATEGGARIGNTEELTLNELAASIKEKGKSPDKILKEITDKDYDNDPNALYDETNRALKNITEIKRLSDEQLDEKAPSDDKVFQAMNESNVSRIITPFLRKTFVYLTRHPDLEPEKSSRLLITEVAAASSKLVKLLELSKKNLEKIR